MINKSRIIYNYNEILSHAMAFIDDDYTELWVIVNKIYEENPNLTFSELIEASKVVVNDLMSNYKVVLIDEETHHPLELSKEQVVSLVEQRLKELNRLPDIGDGLWFTIANR